MFIPPVYCSEIDFFDIYRFTFPVHVFTEVTAIKTLILS